MLDYDNKLDAEDIAELPFRQELSKKMDTIHKNYEYCAANGIIKELVSGKYSKRFREKIDDLFPQMNVYVYSYITKYCYIHKIKEQCDKSILELLHKHEKEFSKCIWHGDMNELDNILENFRREWIPEFVDLLAAAF